MNAILKRCLAMYRRLAQAYPHEFQMVYGEQLELTAEDALPDIWKRQGMWGVFRFVGDVAVRLPVEYLSELRHDALFAWRTLRHEAGFRAADAPSAPPFSRPRPSSERSRMRSRTSRSSTSRPAS